MHTYLETHGRPVALYGEGGGVRNNRKEPAGRDRRHAVQSRLGRLNIDIVCVHTPVAKGPVERAHLTPQDRFGNGGFSGVLLRVLFHVVGRRL